MTHRHSYLVLQFNYLTIAMYLLNQEITRQHSIFTHTVVNIVVHTYVLCFYFVDILSICQYKRTYCNEWRSFTQVQFTKVLRYSTIKKYCENTRYIQTLHNTVLHLCITSHIHTHTHTHIYTYKSVCVW